MAIGSSPKRKPAPKPAESKPKPLKTCVLKVSSQCACEGCKRDVEKTLTQIKGVRTVGINLGEQKVTVKGDVDSQTLIKKLKEKTGKHAELWPQKEKMQKKERSKEKEINPKRRGAEEKETVKIEVVKRVEIKRIQVEEVMILKFNKINKLRI